MLKELLKSVGEYKKQTILTPVTVMGEVIMSTVIPLLMAKIIDNGIYGEGGIPYVLKIGGLMILLTLVSMLFGILSGRFAAVASTGFAKNLRDRIFHKIQAFSFGNIDHFSTASLITRMTTDITYIQMTFTIIIRMLVRSPIMLVLALIMAVSINAQLSIIFVFAIPVLAVALYFISSRAHPLFMKQFKAYDKMNAAVQENLIGIRAVKAFVRTDHEDEKFRDRATEVMKTQKKAEKLLILNGPFMQFAMYGCMIAVSWLGGKQIVVGGMTTGELLSFISYIGQILMSLMMISMAFVMLVMSRASGQRIVEVIQELPDIDDSKAKPDLDIENGAVEFDHVNFSYAKRENNLTLEDVNFNIKPGQMVGIIGGTGSAKTTLVQLIPRLYDVLDGSVKVGGHDVREYDIHTLRNNVAMVLQVNNLFAGTIKDNLRWGKPDATDEEIEAACRAAQAHDFIMSFPDGYDTDLGQGGVNVSGGQKQRLCIARALLKKPKIIILDDSTSAVDVATDSKIREALTTQLKGTTAFIIAQRVTSVMNADQIIVLNDGKINAIGTHDELMASNEIYRDVYESQQKGVA